MWIEAYVYMYFLCLTVSWRKSEVHETIATNYSVERGTEVPASLLCKMFIYDKL